MTQLEPFSWVAVLKDGTIVKMGDVDDLGKEISSSGLNPKDVAIIRLYPLQNNGEPIDVRINIDRGEQFIRFWRQIICPEQLLRINVVGIKTLDSEYRLYVFPNRRIIMSSSDLHETLLEEYAQ